MQEIGGINFKQASASNSIQIISLSIKANLFSNPKQQKQKKQQKLPTDHKFKTPLYYYYYVSRIKFTNNTLKNKITIKP